MILLYALNRGVCLEFVFLARLELNVLLTCFFSDHHGKIICRGQRGPLGKCLDRWWWSSSLLSEDCKCERFWLMMLLNLIYYFWVLAAFDRTVIVAFVWRLPMARGCIVLKCGMHLRALLSEREDTALVLLSKIADTCWFGALNLDDTVWTLYSCAHPCGTRIRQIQFHTQNSMPLYSLLYLLEWT